MPTTEELRAYVQQYAAENAAPEGRVAPQLGNEETESLRNYVADYAANQAPPEGIMSPLQGFQAEYDQELSYADEFTRGLSSGVDMLQASLYAMTRSIGRELGIDSIEGFGNRGMEDNIAEMSRFGPTVARFSDIDSVDDFIRWSAAAFGQAIPSLGTAFAGGGIGGALAKKAVEKSIYRVVRDRMMRQMTAKGFADDVAESAVNRALMSRAGADMLKNGFQNGNAILLQRGFARGSSLGAFAPSAAMQAGETEMTLAEQGIDGSLMAVFGAGFAGGALEALPALRLVDKVFPGVDKKVAGNFIKDFAKGTGTQALLEGSTEGAQEVIQLASLAWHDPSFDLLDPDVGLQVLDAFAAGALVGAVTGGAGEAVSALQQQPDDTAPFRPNLPGGPAQTTERVQDVPPPEVDYPEGFEPADNTVFEEVKGRVQKVVDDQLGPALNKIGTSFNEAQDKIRGVFDANGATRVYQGRLTKYRDLAQANQDEFVAGHQPIVEDVVRYAREYAMWVAEEAAEIADPAEREQMILSRMDQLNYDVGNVAAELGIRGEKLIGSIMGDIDGDPIMDDRTTPAADESDTNFIFGQQVSVKTEFGTRFHYRTRGDNARPYKDRYQARVNMKKMREQFPSAPKEAFSIREVDGGYIIAINDSGIRQQLYEDEVISDAIEKSRISARGNPDPDRKVKVKLPHKKTAVILDLPTLVFDGKRLGEGDVQNVEQAFEAMAARLFERGMLDDSSYKTLREAFDKQFSGREKTMTLNQAQRIREAKIASGEREQTETWIIGKDGQPKKVRQSPDRDSKAEGGTKDTFQGDPALASPGVTEDIDFQRSFTKGKKGSARVTPRATGKKAGRPIAEEETEQALTEGRPFGAVEGNRPVRSVITDPDAESRSLAAQVDNESKTKLPTEEQQAQQSLIDAGGVMKTRSRKGDRERAGPLKKNMEFLKSLMAKYPPPSKRTPQEQAEFEEMSRGLQILERIPRNAQENNRANSIVAKARKRLPEIQKRTRNKIAKSDPEGKTVKVLKPKPLKFEWVASLEGATKGESDGTRPNDIKDRQAAVVRELTSSGLAVEVKGPAKKMQKEIKWLVKKVQNLMPKTRIIVVDEQALEELKHSKNKDLADLAAGLLHGFDSAAMAWLHEMDTAIIRLHKFDESTGNGMAGLIHELGHAIHFSTWQEIGLENQKKLWEAFKADVKAGKRASGAVLNQDPDAAPWVLNMESEAAKILDEMPGSRKEKGVLGVELITYAFNRSHEPVTKVLDKLGPEAKKTYDALADRYRQYIETDETFAQAAAVQQNIFEFKEWMADQFLVWMNTRKHPRSAVHEFFTKVEKKLKEFYAILTNNPGRYGMELNETFAEFADAVARRSAKVGDPATDRYFPQDKIGLGYRVLEGQANSLDLEFKAMERDLGKTKSVAQANAKAKQKTAKAKANKDKIENTPFRGLSIEAWKEMLPRELTYNEIVRSSKALSDLIGQLYDVALAPSTSVMRTLAKDHGIVAANKLVEIFNRTHGQRLTTPNYHQQVKRMSRGFINRYNSIVEGMSETQKRQMMEDLRTGNAAGSLRHRQMRKLFDDIHAYLVKAGLPVGKIDNYVPKMFDRQKLLDNEAAILEYYRKLYIKGNLDPISPQELRKNADDFAKKQYNGLISKEAEQAAAEEELQADELSMQTPGFQAMKSRHAKGEFMDQFLNDNFDSVVANYINQGVKRAEYNRVLGSKAKKGLVGGDAIPRKMWNPQGKLDEIFAEAKAQGANEAQLMRMKNYVDANLGMYGRDDVGETTRKFMAGMVAYQNMRVLLFTVFASLPDMMGPVIRSNSVKTAFGEFTKNIRAIVNGSSPSELAQMAEALGVITDDVSQHVITEYVDNHYMPTGLRKWNDAFFKWTGLNWYTDATRKYALAVGVRSIENAARDAEHARTERERKKARMFLKEFGITPKQVNDWVAAGKPVYNSGTYATHRGRRAARDNAIASALVQFVDESIMSPNPSQRPIAASHPGLMLVYHLKGFMYAVYDTFLKRMKYNFDEAKTVPEHLYVAIPALGMLALTAAGIELRDLITGNDTKDRMDGWEYTWKLFERSGLLGPAQLGWDFQGAGDFGQSEVAALSGPSVSQAGELISRPLSQTIPKAIPVASQLPWMRSMLRGGD